MMVGALPVTHFALDARGAASLSLPPLAAEVRAPGFHWSRNPIRAKKKL